MTTETAMARTITIVFTGILVLMIGGLVRGLIYVADTPRRRRVARKVAVGGDQR